MCPSLGGVEQSTEDSSPISLSVAAMYSTLPSFEGDGEKEGERESKREREVRARPSPSAERPPGPPASLLVERSVTGRGPCQTTAPP